MNQGLVLALDIGGTNARGEVLDARLGAPLVRADLPTPERDGEATIATIASLCRLLLAGLSDVDRSRVCAVGLAVPGIIEGPTGVVRLASNLGWADEPVAARLSALLGLDVVLHHDVTAAGVAEHRLGAGAGASDLLAVFIGTGMAALVVAGGEVVSGGLHQAGEIGHIPVQQGGRPCPCGQTGCLEMYASARAIGRAYGALTGDPDATSLDVVTALGSDPRADGVWAEAMDWLAHGLLGPITLLSPARVVLGGGALGIGGRAGRRAEVAARRPVARRRCAGDRHGLARSACRGAGIWAGDLRRDRASTAGLRGRTGRGPGGLPGPPGVRGRTRPCGERPAVARAQVRLRTGSPARASTSGATSGVC